MSLFEKVSSLLREIKDKSDVAAYLAYSSLLYESKPIARGVLRLEEEVDELRLRLQKILVEEGEELGTESAMAVMLLTEAMERITDLARDLALNVLKGGEAHPVLDLAEEESEEQVLLVRVTEDSIFSGRRIGELAFDDRIGVRAIAVKHRGVWIYDPDEELRLENGDLLLLSGYKAGIEVLEEAEEEVEEVEEV
ncbi:MAG: potassium channel protein [Candidatus Bathyarchaeota archaeon B24]|nr:MAG: potassium channel protein [Candidatus Bathyarchaeota archaeon B24]RLI25728.1 MAG: hypothetical protein DRO57_03155 [Candidatus Bathyarchaeota archaeon]